MEVWTRGFGVLLLDVLGGSQASGKTHHFTISGTSTMTIKHEEVPGRPDHFLVEGLNYNYTFDFKPVNHASISHAREQLERYHRVFVILEPVDEHDWWWGDATRYCLLVTEVNGIYWIIRMETPGAPFSDAIGAVSIAKMKFSPFDLKPLARGNIHTEMVLYHFLKEFIR